MIDVRASLFFFGVILVFLHRLMQGYELMRIEGFKCG